MSRGAPAARGDSPPDSPHDGCPVCGGGPLREVRCKVICANCRTIVQSCADL